MPRVVVTPRTKGLVCFNGHPVGCARQVAAQVQRVRKSCPGNGMGRALVLGASHGYGLASLQAAVFGYGADAVAVCLEHEPRGTRAGTAGYYNLQELQRLAAAAGRRVEVVNADAFAHATRERVVDLLREEFGPVDLVVYSLATGRRRDPDTGEILTGHLKPIGAPYRGRTLDAAAGRIVEVELEPASPEEVAATVRVMGGEDWTLWLDALAAADLLAPGCRSVAYSYIGPERTHPVYRDGAIGAAKRHLEATARSLDDRLAKTGGGAWTSVNQALFTQASAVLPVVPLYLCVLHRVLRERGLLEDTTDQILRLFREHLGPGATPTVDDEGRIRLDDRELDPAVQAQVNGIWDDLTDDHLRETTDYEACLREVRRIYGFGVEGVDYGEAVKL